MHKTYREELLLYRDREYMTEMGTEITQRISHDQDVMHEYSYKIFGTNIHESNMHSHCISQHFTSR